VVKARGSIRALQVVMKKKAAYFILFSVLLIVSATMISCRSLTQISQNNDCDINDRDAEGNLGTKVSVLDKTDPLLGLSSEERLNQNVKACGYQSDDGSFIYVQRNEYTTEEEAIRFYDFSKGLLISREIKDAGDYWEDDVLAIVDKGYMIHAYHEDGLHVDVVGRVGKTTFTIRSRGSRSNKAFSHVKIKGLAVSISRKFKSNISK
jgi:hypothetical protein